MSLKNLSRIYAVHRRALHISREHLRLHRLQRLTRMWHVNCTTQNPAADIESFLFSAYIWKAFVRCLPSAGLISKRQRKAEACLLFPAQSMERAAHCLWSHQAFKNGQETRKKVSFVSFPWSPAERADHPLPPSSKLKCQLLIKPLSIATYNSFQCYLRLHREETTLSTPTPWKCWRMIKTSLCHQIGQRDPTCCTSGRNLGTFGNWDAWREGV